VRFCPFCSAESPTESTHCQACARKLPPLPPRKRAKTPLPFRDEPEVDDSEADERAADGSEAVPDDPDPEATEDLDMADVEDVGEPAPIAVGIATKRTETPLESREPGQPARRSGDRRARPSVPPPPSPTERYRRAAEEVGKGSIPASSSVLDALSKGPGASGRSAPTPVPPPQSRTEPAKAESGPAKDIGSEASAEASAEDSWPAPERPAKEADPHDWSAEDAPPPTRLAVSADHEALGHRPVAVAPVPEVPESGLWRAARYTISFARARWQRRQAIKKLRSNIASDTGRLDAVLGRLGAEARALEIRIPVLSAENEAIDDAEGKRKRADHDCAELGNRQAEENARFGEIEEERQAKVKEAEEILTKAQDELASLEAQRRSLRDKRKDVDRKQKSYIKAAEEREAEAEKAALGSQKDELREKGKGLRRDAGALDPERQDIERRLQALEKPVSQCLAKVESLKAELESVRRSLNDAREGHRLRLAEIEAEQGRKTRELAQAEAEIQRRLITLGTLVNLNRIERPEFRDHYDHIDRLHGAIGSRSNEIDRLSAEREAYDKGSILRGSLALAGLVLLVLTLVLILAALT